MPSDKDVSIMAKAIGLISSIFNPKTLLSANYSSYNACIMVPQKLTFVLFCFPFLS